MFDQSKGLKQLLRELRTLRRRCKALANKDGRRTNTTVRVRAEELAKRYEFVVNSIGDPIGMVDREFKYHAVNDALCHAFGFERAQLLGKHMSQRWGTEVFEGYVRPHLARCFDGEVVNENLWLDLGVHGRRYCHVSFYPYRGEEGRITHAIIVTRDVTHEKEAQDELVRARQTAEEASHAKSDFLANMSHEIRTPMNAISGMTHLLKQTKLSGKQRNFTDTIAGATNNLLRVINDILDFSKVEAGKLELEHVEFSLNETLASLSQVTRVLAQEKSLDFRVVVAPQTPLRLRGDPLRLGQVLLNLTSNAIKFTEKGEIVVTIEPLEDTQPGTELILRFSVKDTGIGLAPEKLQVLFKSFSQADTSTTRRYGGTGLGLAISKRLVEMMGGSITVQSELGNGTEFNFTARFGVPTKPSTGTPRDLGPMLVSGRRVLVVDDNGASQTALSNLLTGFSFDAICVCSGEDAIVEVRRTLAAGVQGYDVILLDAVLPGMSWSEFTKQLHRELRSGIVPATVLIAASGAEAGANSSDSHLDVVLTRPVTRSSLFDAMMQALSKSASGLMAVPSEDVLAAKAKEELRGVRVLLVEDNEINQEVATEILRMNGCVVTAASSGVEAISTLNSTPDDQLFELVLMDLQMPEMDGLEATRRIRGDKRYAKLPIIAMTADAIAGVKEECLAAGMNDYLTKPIKLDELYSTLVLWVRFQRQMARRGVAARQSSMSLAAIADSVQGAPAPERIKILDADSGITRMGGNCPLYERLLSQFHIKYHQASEQIEAALTDNNRMAAANMLNAIKSTASSLGADALSRTAAEWEDCLLKEKDAAETSACRERFRGMASETMGVIEKMLRMNKRASVLYGTTVAAPVPGAKAGGSK